MLGAFFERLRAGHRLLRNLFLVALVVLIGLNVMIRPEEPEFGWDAIPGSFAAFGVIAGAVLLVVMEKIVRPLIARKEDFYGDI